MTLSTLPVIHTAQTKWTRDNMPQITDTGAFLAYLHRHGIDYRSEVLRADDLHATQNEVNLKTVFELISKGLDTAKYPIITSSDLHVLDGNHRYWAARTEATKVHVIRVDAEIHRLIELAGKWDGVSYKSVTSKNKITSGSTG